MFVWCILAVAHTLTQRKVYVFAHHVIHVGVHRNIVRRVHVCARMCWFSFCGFRSAECALLQASPACRFPPCAGVTSCLRASPLCGFGPFAGFATVRVTPFYGCRQSTGFAPLRVLPQFRSIRVKSLCMFRSLALCAPLQVSPLCGRRIIFMWPVSG